jgi:hypothetical protein
MDRRRHGNVKNGMYNVLKLLRGVIYIMCPCLDIVRRRRPSSSHIYPYGFRVLLLLLLLLLLVTAR